MTPSWLLWTASIICSYCGAKMSEIWHWFPLVNTSCIGVKPPRCKSVRYCSISTNSYHVYVIALENACQDGQEDTKAKFSDWIKPVPMILITAYWLPILIIFNVISFSAFVFAVLSGGNNWLMGGHDGRIPGKGKKLCLKSWYRHKWFSFGWKTL